MFKNRIRTAAIAGIAALATGLGGFAVPTATAQTTVEAPGAPAGEYFTHADASAAFDATPVNHTEDELKLATDETSLFLTEEAPAAWEALHGNLNFDPSEEASAERVREILDLVIAEQEYNDGVIHAAQESIAYAYQQDRAARSAWNALEEYAVSISNDLYARDKAPVSDTQDQVGEILYIPRGDDQTPKPLDEFAPGEYWNIIEAINYHANQTGADTIEADLVPDDIEPADTAEVKTAFINALPALQDRVNDIYDLLGDYTYDQASGDRANRDFSALVQELNGELNDAIAELDELREASNEANRNAQLSDVLVRQAFLERAVAQRDYLRNWEGFLLAWARYIELYNDPTLTLDRTLLSEEYREILEPLEEGLERNYRLLVEADEAVTEGYIAWDNDHKYGDDRVTEGWAIVEERLQFSQGLYQNIRENGAIWREALNRVQALEIELGQPSDADRLIAAIEALLNEGDNGDDAPGNGNDDPDNGAVEGGSAVEIDGSSEGGFGTIGILAGIAAVIGLIAAAIPFLGNFLPNLPF